MPVAGHITQNRISLRRGVYVAVQGPNLETRAEYRMLRALGAEVELMGASHTVDAVAALAGTIGYEVLTRLGSRFHRRYV